MGPQGGVTVALPTYRLSSEGPPSRSEKNHQLFSAHPAPPPSDNYASRGWLIPIYEWWY